MLLVQRLRKSLRAQARLKGLVVRNSAEREDDQTVCILGMGFVGVTLAAAMTQVGFNVIGVEVKSDLVQRLRTGKAHFFEPGLGEQLTAAVRAGRLMVYERIPDQCAASVFIITVGTPLGPDGRADLGSIRNISHQIADRLKDKDLVVLRSTVRLGTTEETVKPILMKSAKQFDLAYCPERTVEGQALAELRVLPQIVGADEYQAAVRAARLFQRVTPTVVRVSNTRTAELIKLVDNAARDVIFAYSNEVAGMCEAIGVSADEVVRSGRFGYSRAGLPKPGPVGGPCLSKDGYILAESMQALGLQSLLTRAARVVNEEMPVFAGRQVGRLVRERKIAFGSAEIAVLGVAFKGRPPTDDIRGTTVPLVVEGIKAELSGAAIRAWDPIVPVDLTASLGLRPVSSVEEAFDGADAVVIHTDHPMFSSLPIGSLAELMRTPAIIYDLWNIFTETGLLLPDGVQYLAFGSVQRSLMSVIAQT